MTIKRARWRGMKWATLVENVSASSRSRASSSRRRRLRRETLPVILALIVSHLCNAIDISKAEATRIGNRIWQNECGGTIEGLASWNAGEDFASIGIGHFIWYPRGQTGPFQESFPQFLHFAVAHGAKPPEFLLRDRAHGCPWNSRAEFLRPRDSASVKQLRQFLADAVDLQTQFLIQRLQDSLPKMLAQANEPENVRRQFERVGATAEGCYALVDYVNFKGEGTLATERYRGAGWGLLQVLENMHRAGGQSALDEFAASAKNVLQQRVANSPPERGEARWLRGWLARIETYRAK